MGCRCHGSICGHCFQGRIGCHKRIETVTYSAKKHRFASEGDLLSFLGSVTLAADDQVGIIAGHFMLMYDDKADGLVPMVYQDALNPKVKEFSQKMAGDFPVNTFRHGIHLLKTYQSRQITSKLALIVNDHIFQTDGWSPQNLNDMNRAGKLRHDFYRQKYPLPKAFFGELKSAGLATDVLLDNNNPARTPTDIVPKTTRLFSEQALRNYFDQNTRPELRESPMFSEIQQNGAKSKLMFVGDSGSNSVCLTEDGDCGCSGELIEFFARLAERAMRTVVFFVPAECKIAAEAGVKAFLHTPSRCRGNLARVFVVHGFGGMGISNPKNSPIHLTVHWLSEQAAPHAH